MFKIAVTFALLGICMVSAVEYLAAPALIPRYAAQYIAPFPGAPLALSAPYVAAAPLVTPLGLRNLPLPLAAAAGYSQYSSVSTPDSFSQQYRAEQKPLPYTAIIY